MKKQIVILSIFLSLFSISTDIKAPKSLESNNRILASTTLSQCLKSVRSFFISKQKPVTSKKTSGFEIELFKPDHLDQESVAQIINKLTSLNYEAIEIKVVNSPNANQYDYIITANKNNETKVWQVPYEPDFYNYQTNETNGVEITSPIISSKEDKEDFFSVLKELKNVGLTRATDVGGNHIHIGKENMTVGELTTLFQKVLKRQNEITNRFMPDSGRKNIGMGVLTVGLNRLENLNPDQKLSELNPSLVFFNQGAIRYNLKHQTIEFRFFNSTLDKDELLDNENFVNELLEEISK